MYNREIIIAKTMKKLGQDLYKPMDTREEEKEKREQRIDSRDIKLFAQELLRIYKKYQNNYEELDFPKAILKYVGDFMDRVKPTRDDKIKLLNEAKKNKLFNFSLNKNLERAWRAILKNWDMKEYRLEGGY